MLDLAYLMNFCAGLYTQSRLTYQSIQIIEDSKRSDHE